MVHGDWMMCASKAHSPWNKNAKICTLVLEFQKICGRCGHRRTKTIRHTITTWSSLDNSWYIQLILSNKSLNISIPFFFFFFIIILFIFLSPPNTAMRSGIRYVKLTQCFQHARHTVINNSICIHTVVISRLPKNRNTSSAVHHCC